MSEDPRPPPAVVIDRRPLWRILVERMRKPAFLVLLGVVFVVLTRAAPPDGLAAPGWRALLIFGLTVVLWASNALPVAATALIGIVLIPLLGVLERARAFSLFGNETLFFIIGAFILAAAIMKTGLSTRLALFCLLRFGRTPSRLLGSILIVSALFSFVLPQQVVAAMLFPILLDIAKATQKEEGGRRFARALFLAMAWGCVAGGVATLASAARNALVIEIVRQVAGRSISFFEWTADVLPAVALTVAAALATLLVHARGSLRSTEGAVAILRRKLIDLGKVTLDEQLTAMIVIGTMTAWAVWGREQGLGNIAVASAASLFVLRIVGWRDVESTVNWGIVLMLGGAIVLGAALHESGAARWLMQPLLRWQGQPLAVIAVLSAVALLMSEPISGAAVVTAMVPMGLAAARDLGVDPKAIAYAIAIPAGWGFLLPSGTAPLALAYSSGYLRTREVALAGVAIDLASWLAFLATALLWWPLRGFGP